MRIFGICLFFSLSAVCALVAVGLFLLYLIFEHRKDLTAGTVAFLKQGKHKKDVAVWSVNRFGGAPHVVTVLKHLTRGVYVYTVGGKQYRIRYTEHVTKRQMPKMLSITYLKKFPLIAHVKTDIALMLYDIYALMAAAFSVLLLFAGLRLVM